MAQLDQWDLKFCVQRLPKKVVDIMKDQNWVGKMFMGGGFIRGVIAQERLNDVDLFARSTDDAHLLAGLLADNKSDIHKTDNAITIRGKLPIQIITRWVFDKPEDVTNSFDFTICCAVVFYSENRWQSYCDDRFYVDLASKRLVYRSPSRNEDPGGSILRVLKYYQRGYRIPLDSLGAVVARTVGKIDFDKIAHGSLPYEDQLAKVVTGLLREVDPNVDIDHQSHLPAAAQLESEVPG